MTVAAPAGFVPPTGTDTPRRWGWSRERLRERLSVRAEAIRDAVLAPLLAELDQSEADALRRDRDGWPALLDRLLDDLDLRSALQLLPPGPPSMARSVSIPELTWQEAALDFVPPDTVLPDAASPAGTSRGAVPPDTARTGSSDTGVVPIEQTRSGSAPSGVVVPSELALDRRCTRECADLAAEAVGRVQMPAPLRARLLSLLPGASPEVAGEAAVLDAILFGRHDTLVAALSAATELSDAAVRNALATTNRRGLVAMAWKAGYGMRIAWLLQVLAAGIEPHHALDADADGGCPLGRAEMMWQLGFMERAASS